MWQHGTYYHSKTGSPAWLIDHARIITYDLSEIVLPTDKDIWLSMPVRNLFVDRSLVGCDLLIAELTATNWGESLHRI